MKPLVAIVGRPNVGKSTLFNRLVGRRIALVQDEPGVTRDRHYADAEWGGRKFTFIDTGGFVAAPASPVSRRDAVAAALAEVAAAQEDASFAVQPVNGLPGLAIRRGGRTVGIVVVALRRSRVADIWMVLNPEKLRHWNR